jgi:hypothetical protein
MRRKLTKPKIPKPVKILAKHYNCKNAYLMQNGNNPIIARCEIYHERFVANCNKLCSSFVENTSEPIIHKMIPAYED